MPNVTLTIREGFELVKTVRANNRIVAVGSQQRSDPNFIEALKSRKDPVVPIEIGHRTCTACTLGNIAHELGRLVEWNPANETIVNDKTAEAYLHYDYQNGYTL